MPGVDKLLKKPKLLEVTILVETTAIYYESDGRDGCAKECPGRLPEGHCKDKPSCRWFDVIWDHGGTLRPQTCKNAAKVAQGQITQRASDEALLKHAIHKDLNKALDEASALKP